MQDSAKYLIHARITANGVVERSDVVGAVFGQTEGLLGEQLDLRELQESAKVGRIDVEVSAQSGRSTGEITIASGLDRVETAILAAALETIERVGPCRAQVDVTDLKDVRQAKRRQVVDRAKELLGSFDESILSSDEIVGEVRRSARVDRITDYEGYPAGPRVADSDAIIVVEGRADVLRLLEYGIKNAVAVEGTDVPEAVAELTRDRTVTAFLDGDRGGDLILKELAQVGRVDYVAFAPPGRCVEDLSREAVLDALREKLPYEDVAGVETPHEHIAATDGRTLATGATGEGRAVTNAETGDVGDTGTDGEGATTGPVGADTGDGDDVGSAGVEDDDTEEAEQEGVVDRPLTLSDHVAAVIDGDSGRIRLLDEGLNPIDETGVDEAFEAVLDADPAPTTVLIDGELSQRVLDVAAQRGVDHIVARSEGQFVKRPTSVHVQTA